MRTATLERTVTVTWQDRAGEWKGDVRVVYQFDGDRDFAVMDQEILGDGFPTSLSESVFNEMVDDAVFEYAAEDYNNWLSGQDDARED